jgi:hypothetical protein
MPNSIAKQLVELAKIGETAGDELKELVHHLLTAASKLAKLLKDENQTKVCELLCNIPWVPATDGQRTQLLPPSRVAYTLRNELWPRFGRLPDAWTNNSSLKRLLTAAGVGERVSCLMLAQELRSLAEDASVQSSPKRQKSRGKQTASLAQSPLAAGCMDLALRMASELAIFLNDAPWTNKGETHELLHDEISPAHGMLLGCSSAREELVRLCEEENALEGEEFAQSELLAKRIGNLLQKYNDEKDVFVEQCAERIQTCTAAMGDTPAC